MTVKDFQKQVSTHSTNELHLLELAVYRELEKRGELSDISVDEETLDEIVEINEQMKKGTTKTYTISEFETEMDKHRAKKA